MIIAVDAKGLRDHSPNSFAVMLLLQFAQYPEVKLIFLTEGDDQKIQALFPAALFVPVGKKTGSRIALTYRYTVTVPGLLKKHNAGLFISFNLDSPATQIPRFFFIDNEYLKDKKNRKAGALKKKWKSINKESARLFVTAPVFKNEIIVSADMPGDKIILINPFAALSPQPAKTAEKDLIKSAITGGREFVSLHQFLFPTRIFLFIY
ncbi:MAG: hypothetical protein HC867_00800 [Bacteroidia bacterium]|nr:hypothetical protein [Bacteroidia bacterium]